jgi:hypothetical protein
MPRPVAQHSEPVNSDSFLDIVASVVSIMIIMVVMVGMRIKNAPVAVSLPANPAVNELEKEAGEEQSLSVDIAKLQAETRDVKAEIARRGLHRNILVTTVAAVEQKIQEERQSLDAGKRADFDIARGLSESKYQIEQLGRQLEDANNTQGAPTIVESYPTPISRAVDGPEAHLLIRNGRVVFVPLQALAEEAVARAKRQIYKLQDQSELTDTVGPIEGFRLRYTIGRHDIGLEEFKSTGRGGSRYQLESITAVPTSDDLGEPVRLALAESSEFRSALRKILPGRTTITIWVYPDGFDAFRQVRKELYRLGYSIAARVLPFGESITGSPGGSKSAAQ